jgi:hypothetical protein
MKEVAAQHEHVHAGACHAQPSASLVNLQANCQLQIDSESHIRGTTEATDSKATSKLDASISTPDQMFSIKGPRQCRQKPTKKPFWSDLFTLGKTATTARNHILIDGWTFNPRPGIYAEKVISSTCGPTATLPGPFAAYGPIGACSETTTITVRLKKR